MIMSNPGPLAALVYGFILIVLLSVSLILYSIGRTIKNEIGKGIAYALTGMLLILSLLVGAFILTLLT